MASGLRAGFGCKPLMKPLRSRCCRTEISFLIPVNRLLIGAIFDQMTQEHMSKIPRGRFVTVEEIASLTAFCAASDCSFTAGAVFDISGGRVTY